MKRERTPVRLFVIAAAADAAFQAVLEKHLFPLWQQGFLANWQSVQPGEEAQEACAAAKMILLLISADFGSGLCENDGPFEIVTVEKEFQACNVHDI